MIITTANIRQRRMPLGACEIYVGRANPRYGVAQSPLANPFVLAQESERTLVVARYREWLAAKIAAEDPAIVTELERLAGIARSHGELQLVCWCTPRACHADALAELLTERLARNP